MKALALSVVVAALGCGGGNKGGDTSVSNTPGGGGTVSDPAQSSVPCELEIALQCANGMIDGCLEGKTTVHACVAADAAMGPPCAQEIALECPDGQIDACLQTPASAENHICVVK